MNGETRRPHTMRDGRVLCPGDLVREKRGRRASFKFLEASADHGLLMLRSLKTGGVYLRDESVVFEIIPRSK